MIIKLLRDHLPWVAPSAAIVFAASGFFDRSSNSEPSVQAPAPSAFDASLAAATQNSASSSDFTSGENDVVTRLSTVTDSSLQALAPAKPQLQLEQAVAKAIQPEAPAVEAIAPKPVEAAKPEPTETRTASLGSTENAATFFANAQANIAARESCIGDLRALADQARVYFPAGGLNADPGGIEQARLIGTLVQDCQGVQIIVEGHSDPSGDPAANLRLSKKRAEQIIQRLSASGIDTTNFIAEGIGSARPSNVVGPESSAYYDRRVEFAVIETKNAKVTKRKGLSANQWTASSCVKDLQQAIQGKNIFYAPRSVAAKQSEVNTALDLATMAMACPDARLRVIGQHSDDLRAGENPATGRLRAKAMMAMLVGQGIDSTQIIIAAPSRAKGKDGLSGSRLDFDVIVE